MSNNETVEVISIDDATRLRVVYDADAENPATWGDHIDPDGPEIAAWRDGEVYGVIVERRVQWARIGDGEPRTMETWGGTDSLWGCYLNNEYTARVVALEYFGIGGE